MIIIDRQQKEWQIKDQVAQLSLSEYDAISEILVSGASSWTQVIQILEVCGLPNEVAEQIGFKSLVKAYKNLGLQEPVGELKPNITINGVDYPVFTDEFELTGSQMGRLEAIIKDEQPDKTLRLMLILTDASDVERAEREATFREHLTVADAAPYVAEIYRQFTESLI